MPFTPRSFLFLSLILLEVALLPCSNSAFLDEEARQKEISLQEPTHVWSADMAPEPPQDLVVDVQSESVVLLTWGEPSDSTDLDHYLVYVEDEDMEDSTENRFYVWNFLEACTNYTFGVRSVSAVGDMSAPELGDGRTQVGGPPPPQNLHGESKSSTSMTLTWNEPDTPCDVESYRVKWSLDGTDPESTQVTNTSFTVPNLLPSTTYIFSVSAFASSQEGDPATIQETTVKDEGGPPEDLVAVGVSTSAINVSWSPPPYKTPDYYKVNGLPCMYLDTIVFGLSYLITELEPCERCQIYVTSVYDNGLEYTASTEGETLPGDPPAPRSCSVDVQDDYLTVEWKAPDSNCALGKYNALWNSTKLWGDGEKDSGSVNTSATRYSMTDPAPYTKFSFDISASIDGVFGSPASCSGTSHEAPASPPTKLLQVSMDLSSVTIQWSLPESMRGKLLRWYLYWTSVNGQFLGEHYLLNPEQRAFQIGDLAPSEVYYVYVTAVNGAGKGEAAMLETSTEFVP